eukprot:s424_g25.t1
MCLAPQRRALFRHRVNGAEAEFWRLSTGERIADSTQILGFECGGVQWVLENCFPCGTIDEPNLKDIRYVKEMILGSCLSRSPMSPAYSTQENALFSWVGVIMYITSEEQAPAIKEKFRAYAIHHADLTFKYDFWWMISIDGFFHWGKIDLNFHAGERRKILKEQFAKKFNVQEFARLKSELDPNNAMLDMLRWFASAQIRNVAVLAGNIATASPISDMNPVLMALDASLILASAGQAPREVPMKEFFKSYRVVDMQPAEVICAIKVPGAGDFEFVRSFKQAMDGLEGPCSEWASRMEVPIST